MSQYSDPYSSSNPPPSIGAPAGQPYPPPRPQVVHVVSKPGGFWRALSLIAGLFLFAIVFAIGLTLGIVIMLAGASMDQMLVEQEYRHGSGGKVTIIPIEGVIDNLQAEFMRTAADHVLKDRDVKAVVLRVDSPGGGVTESDQIWYQVKRLQQHGLPVVASYGGVAASGGYYISCGADYIMAQETTITGSIGVIAQILTLEQLMQKIGVQPVTLVASGSPQKDVANDIFRAWTDEDKQKVRVMLDAAYATFTQRVRDGRKTVITEPSHLEEVANGSIYTAQQALEHKLIDAIGYLDDAVAAAESRAQMKTGSADVVMLRPPPTLVGALLGAQAGSAASGAGAIAAGGSLDAQSVRRLVNDLATPRAMYLMH